MLCRQEESGQGNLVDALGSGRISSAWVILTDLKPEEALVSWYGLRTWIEGGENRF